MKKILRWLFGTVISILLLVVALLTVVIVFEIPIDLTRFKEPVEALVSKGLDRQVRIEKSIVVSTSTTPYFTIQGLRIENPAGFKTADFLSMDLAKIQIELLPLLKKKIHISEIQVQGLTVTLEETEDGRVNWIFNSDDKATKEIPAEPEVVKEPTSPKQPLNLSSDTLVVRKLDLQDIKVEIHRPGNTEPANLHLKNCLGAMVPGEPLHLDIDGNVIGFDYSLDVSIASLEELLVTNKSWLEIRAGIAETEMTFSGNVDLATTAKSLFLQTTVKGENLASLNDLLHLDLPPFTSYELETRLHLQPKQYELQKLLIKTGTSSLEGSAKIVQQSDKTSIDLQLRSPLVQIDEFVFDDWSWSDDKDAEENMSDSEVEATKEGTETENVAEKASSKPENKKLVDPELLAKLDCLLVIEAEKVLSGEDVLGSGQLQATVKDGRIKIEPLMFQLPGGKIELMASIKPGTKKSDAELKVEIQNFDIGILVRRTKPESDMGGFVNLDINIQSSATTIPDLLANGNGYFDFSGNLENFGAGIIDLWAVNLIAAIVSNANKEQSELNCAVGRWSVIDGLLQSEAFFIDTSKIRICADGEVDFKDEMIDITVKPKAKRAEFFSLATPLKVNGSFSDINIGLGGGGIVGTAIKFIASPVSVPLKRVFSDKIPADGSDVCNMPLGKNNRTEIVVPMCSSN